MSDSDSDTQISVQMPEMEASKPEKKPRKKMVVTEQRRAASQANIIKAREARAKKKEARLQAETEHQQILNELVAEKKKSKSQPTPPIGKPEKPSKPYAKLSSSESESEESEESESEESEESDVEYVLKPAKKKQVKEKAKKSAISAEVEALKAQIAALQIKKQKAPKPAPVNLYFGRQPTEKKATALDQKVQWD